MVFIKGKYVACKKNSGKDFVSAIKGNRLVAASRNDKLAGNLSALELDWGSVKELYIQGFECKQVFTNVDGSQGIWYLVTSDVNLILAKQLKSIKKDGTIEVYHKSLKQNAALVKSPTKTVKTQSNHIFVNIFVLLIANAQLWKIQPIPSQLGLICW